LKDEQERILVVPRRTTRDLDVGFVPVEDALAKQVVRAIQASRTFLERKVAEADPQHVQPIALAYIVHDDSVLVLRRDSRDGSDALRGRDVLWVGGHIDRIDRNTGAAPGGGDTISRALRRELLDEELPELPADLPRRLVGLVTDDSSVRSCMHLGLVHEIRIHDAWQARTLADVAHASGEFACRPAFVRIAELRAHPDLLEPWSRSILTRRLCQVEMTRPAFDRVVPLRAGRTVRSNPRLVSDWDAPV
jgi:predicted NUDIX family phosphoesterase